MYPTTLKAAAQNRAAWVATASVNSGNAFYAITGTSPRAGALAAPKTAGQWFQVDMGSPQSFYELVLDATPSPNDYPRGYGGLAVSCA